MRQKGTYSRKRKSRLQQKQQKKKDVLTEPLDGIVRLLRKLEDNNGAYTVELLDEVLNSHHNQQAIIFKAAKYGLIKRERDGHRINNYVTMKGRTFLQAVDEALVEKS